MRTTGVIELNNSKLITDIREIITNGRQTAYQNANAVMIETYWKIGERIICEEQAGNGRAEYGKAIIKHLSSLLQIEFGDGFSERYLRAFRKFYMLMPDFQIWKSRFPNQRLFGLSTSYYRKKIVPIMRKFLSIFSFY